MFVTISIALLALTALVMLTLRLTRPSFGYHWLIAAGGAFITWVTLLYIGLTLPISIEISAWGLGTVYPNSIFLIADQISWPFALGLGTLILATLLTDVVRAYDLEWSNWASSLILTSFGLIGVFSGNLLTFILAWMAFDLIGIIILLSQLQSGSSRRRAVVIFFSHLLGTACLLIAGVISVNDNNSVLLERASPGAILFVILAAGFRLGAISVDSLRVENPAKRRSLGTVMSLASAAIVLVFLVRVASVLESVELGINTWGILFALMGFLSLLSAAAWLLAKDEMDGRHAWITGVSAIIMAATLRAQPEAGMAWGIALMFIGGLIFLASVRDRFSMWITLLGLVGISTLPFTPAWNGLVLFNWPISLPLILYFVAIVFLVWGFARHSTQIKQEPPGLERWIKFVYPMGLLLLPIVQIGLGWVYRPAINEVPIMGWILGALICVLAFLGFFWQQRGGKVPHSIADRLNALISLDWLYFILKIIFNYLSRFIFFISNVLEGEGGLLWVLLWIVLFLAILLIGLGT